MARRGENIYRRKDGRWEGRCRIGRKPDGRPIFSYVYDRSYGACRDKLVQLKAVHCAKGPQARSTAQFRECLLGHLAQKRISGIKASSYGSYHRIVHNHLLPGLGPIPMHLLTRRHVEQFLDDLRKTGLSDGTVLNIFRYLSNVTKAAVKSGAIAKDVCAEIAPPKPKQKKVKALTRAQQKIVEQAALSSMQSADKGLDVMIALNTGLRVGEICALRWEDVDLDNGVIHVSHTLQRLCLYGQAVKTAIVTDAPKSESSARDVPVNALLLKLLRARKKHAKSEYVVEGRYGPAEPRVLQYRFEQLLERARLPRVGYHALRHSFATRCMEQGVRTAVISELLGHSSSKITEETYIHALMEQRFAAVYKLDELAA